MVLIDVLDENINTLFKQCLQYRF